ncbi:hypothetical protein Ahy_B09g097974 [Arachis hypogaea]|uniref:Photosystem I iron-sulfur center n=1 Tax=Arachis hypogaea TaxID=3818 RepID=A0A444XQU7_ARAHY|nr:hypothetical protein Ahy_B09g097974 [Arachis hypogaea]
MSHSVKIYDTCIGCTQCVRACPTDVLEMISCRDSKSDDNCALSDFKRAATAAAAATNAVASTAVYVASTSQLWCSSSDMTTGKGVADQPSGRGRGHDRGRISAGILENSGSSPSNLTILVTSQVADASEQLFIMVSNPNYVPTSSTMPLPPSAQKPTVSEMPPPATNTVAPKLSHGSQPADAPLPPPIVRIMIWLMVEWHPNLMSYSVKIYDTCIGCTQCVRTCPTDVLEMIPWDGCKAKQIASDPRMEDCVGCKRCESAYPIDFLSVRVYLWHETTPSMGLAY